MNISKHIVVKGRVQGVSYRQSAKKTAEKMGINGTVKNLSDGTVEIFATGNDDDMPEFIAWCNEGPSLAKVTAVTVLDIPVKNFETFSIL